ncbi:hypothetical protein GCM10009624_16190 [Gordonia sinesedis]
MYAAFYLPGAAGWLVACCWAGIVAWLRSPLRGPTRLGIRQESGATVIQIPFILKLPVGAILVLLIVACTVFSLGMWTHSLSFPMLPRQEVKFPFVAISSATVALLIVVNYLSGRVRSPVIMCTPTHLRIDGKKARQVVDWNQVESIDPVVSGQDWHIRVSLTVGYRADVSIYGPRWFTPTQRELARLIEVEVDAFAIGPYRLLRFLRFYQENAAERQELLDCRALKRLESV